MKNLKCGSRGALVELLQLALNRAGAGPIPVDGCLGAATMSALGVFARSRGMHGVCEVTPHVWDALEPYIACRRAYMLKPGETPKDAAERFGASLQSVLTANPRLEGRNACAGELLTVPLPFEPVPGIAWSDRLNTLSLRALSSAYPCLQPLTWGRSALGRRLRGLSFGEGERTLIFTAAHHANEWITAPALLRFARHLAGEFSAGAQWAAQAQRRVQIIFAPLVDPDGVDLVTGALGEGPALERAGRIAADYPAVAWPEGWKANIRGTDLNLQYPAGWDSAREIKYAQGWTGPAPRDFVGAAPLCAPEACALYTLTRRVQPALVLALHTQGEVIYWQYHGYAPHGAQALAEKMAAASGYALDSAPDESGNAGYKDWVIDALDVPAFTVECGLGESPLPIAQLGDISRAVGAICRECVSYAVTA